MTTSKDEFFCETDVRSTYRFLAHRPRGVTELRVIAPRRGILGIGYFDNEDSFVQACDRANGTGNVYVGIQPRPACFLEQASNRIMRLRRGAKDDDIGWVVAVVLDIDPERPKHTAATDAELARAVERGKQISAWAVGQGYLEPRLNMSGNGCQLWFALPPFEVTGANRPVITAQLKAFEAGVRSQFNGDGVSIDSIYNLSRIIKVIGTRSIKGDNTRESPHRLSASLSAFERAEDPDLLDAIQALPVEDRPAPKTRAESASAATTSGLSDRILELLDSSRKLNALFEGRGKPTRGTDGKRLDESSSGYDFSLALSLARKGISDPAELAAAIYHRPDGEARAKGPSYIERTVERALSRATVLRGATRTDARDDGPGTESELPSILVSDRELRDVSRDAVDALTRANDPPVVFQRGMTLARVRQVDTGLHRLETFVQASMRGRLGRVANWRKETITRRGDIRQTAVSPPIDVVQDVLALPAWPFPSIEGVVAAPVFSSDGHLMTRTGYHSDARLWIHLDRELAIEPVSLAPSDAEVEQARSLLVDDLLGEFPFVDQASRAHAFAALLLPFVRPMTGKATPLHLIDAPSPGTGKSLLGDVICIPATGQPAQAMTEAHDEDEWRKRLTAAILEAPVFLLLDNLNRPLKSGKLAVALTTGLWQDRILGRTETVTIPVTNVWLATGNNVALSDEIARRSIWIRLDARVDQPWMRSGFRHSDLQTWARKHRGELIRAALTLGQAWVAAGKPRDTSSLGGFETWAGTMGGILSVAGVPGFLGNLKDLYARADEDTADWRAFVEHWWERHQDRPVKTQELYQLAHDTELLDAVLGDKSERSQKTRLGRALGKKRDRVVGEHRIEAGGRDYKARNVFRLRRTDSDAHSPSAGDTLEMFSNRAGTSPAMSAPGNHVGTTSVTSALANADLVDRTRAYAALSHAQSTRRGYRSDWARFEAWCASKGASALPAEPATVALYLTDRADEGRKVSTLQRSLAAISKAHRSAGHRSPTRSEAVQRVMRGIKRARGAAQIQKAALSVEELRRMCRLLPETTCGVRDRALLLVGFAGAFRRSELAALNVEDIDLVDDGLKILVRRSKTDQEGEGRIVAVPFGSDPATCPVRSLQRWLDVAQITEGAVFRAVNRGGRLTTRRQDGDGRLSARDVARVVKRAARAAGLDASKLGGHSLRAGLATAAAKSGKSERAIMAQTGHRSPMMVRRYIRDANLFAENAAAGIGL